MKRLIIFGIITLITFLYQIFKEDPESIDTSIVNIVKAYKSGNAFELNQYIHPELGLYILFNNGEMTEFKKVDSIDFKHPFPENLPYENIDMFSNVRFFDLPVYDSYDKEWDKIGLYCDTTSTGLSITHHATKMFKLDKASAIKTLSHEFFQVDNESYCVILVDKSGTSFVFQIKFIDDKWYMTILDRAYTIGSQDTNYTCLYR